MIELYMRYEHYINMIVTGYIINIIIAIIIGVYSIKKYGLYDLQDAVNIYGNKKNSWKILLPYYTVYGLSKFMFCIKADSAEDYVKCMRRTK